MKYRTGFVVGKFAPLHFGHELVINTALAQCEEVVVLSYTSRAFKNCSAAERETWLKVRFPTPNIRIVVLDPDDYDLPDDDADGDIQNQFCANILLNYLHTTVQAVFSSEDYGDGLAAHLAKYFTEELKCEQSVQHVMVDRKRWQLKISGTELRDDANHALREKFLAPQVRGAFIPKVLLLGGESSGKSTLAEALGEHLGTKVVPEYGRTLYEHRGGKLFFEDLEFIGKHQISNEDRASTFVKSGSVLICDTSALTTMFYSKQMFGRVSRALQFLALNITSRYDIIYLCDPNIPFDQDGTRQDEAFRMLGHEWYIQRLARYKVPYTLVSGSVQDRVQQVSDDLKNRGAIK
jgi:HTH-type transcriptional repressor of NAD biosynthesis genes